MTIATLAEDGVSSEQYELTVVRGEPDRNNLLASLQLADFDLLPAFDPQQDAYEVTVPYPAQEVRLLAQAQSELARVELSAEVEAVSGARSAAEVAGSATGRGAVLVFVEGDRLHAELRVVAQDDSERVYRIVVHRAEPDRDNALSLMGVLSGELRPQFQPAQLRYRVKVPFATTRVDLIAQPRSAVATVSLLGADIIVGRLSSAEGAGVDLAGVDQLSLMVTVTAQDGSQRDYQLDVFRGPPDSNSALALLDFSAGALRPRFAPRTASYTLQLPAQAPSVTITAFTDSPVATVAEADSSGPASAGQTVLVELEPGASRVVTLIVTAEDGSQRIYRVNVRRLRALGQSTGGQGSGGQGTAGQGGGGQAAQGQAEQGQPEQQDESTGPSTGTASGLERFAGEISIRSGGALRLQPREAEALAAAGGQLEAQASVKVRYYRSNNVLLEDAVPIQVRQTRQVTSVVLNYTARGIEVEPDRLLEVQVAIPAGAGHFVHYTEAVMTESKMDVDIPFLLYGPSPDVAWPPIGDPAELAGFMSRTTDELRGRAEADNDRGAAEETGTIVELTDATGALLVRENVGRSRGLDRGQMATFDQPVTVPEGATVRYRLMASNRGSRQLTAAGTARVWTTKLAYAGGFEAARLFIVEDDG